MKQICIAGNLGRDAEYKTTSNSELCSFPVAVTDGYGDNKTTLWFDVTRWGKGADGLARILRKGSKVAVTGELSTREHDGKTYLQVRADNVTIQGMPQTGERKQSYSDGSQGAPADNGGQWDDEPEVPFITSAGIF